MISTPDRQEAVSPITDAVATGARKRQACAEVGITLRTLERWVADGAVRADRRPQAVRPPPSNKLTEAERAEVLRVVNEPRFASRPPTQIVPSLADEGKYLASESSFYRILREANQLKHRGRARAPQARAVPRHCAQAPNQLYAWDITYLPGPIQGMFFFLYLVLDVYSRKIVAHEVHEAESAEHAAGVIEQAVRREGVPRDVLVVHQDNGSPMKGSTYLAKLAELGIKPSYSRPGVSDDNAYAESLFRTCKYRRNSLGRLRAWTKRGPGCCPSCAGTTTRTSTATSSSSAPHSAMRAKRKISSLSASPCIRRRARNTPAAGVKTSVTGRCRRKYG